VLAERALVSSRTQRASRSRGAAVRRCWRSDASRSRQRIALWTMIRLRALGGCSTCGPVVDGAARPSPSEGRTGSRSSIAASSWPYQGPR
jgi:hypothetical protein